MINAAYQKFVARWEEVMELPPQQLGLFTPVYKKFVKHLKVMPWPVLVFGAGILVFGLYVFIGSTIASIVSLLQRGF